LKKKIISFLSVLTAGVMLCACTSKLEQVIIERSRQHASGELTRISEDILSASSTSEDNMVFVRALSAEDIGGSLESEDIDISEIEENPDEAPNPTEDPLAGGNTGTESGAPYAYSRGDHGPLTGDTAAGEASGNVARIPAEFITSKVGLEKEAAAQGAVLTFDTDGNAVFSLETEEQRLAAKTIYADQIRQALKAIPQSGKYTNVEEVKTTRLYTKFTVKFKNSQLDPNMNTLADTLCEFGSGYAKIRDAVVESIRIEYRDDDDNVVDVVEKPVN
jgi:hypothetical protein